MSTEEIENHYYSILSAEIDSIQENIETSSRYKLAAICRLVNTVNTYYGQHMMDYMNWDDLDTELERYNTDKFTQVYPFPYHNKQ